MGQQRIRHYQHPTSRYRHRRDMHTAHVLLVHVRFQALRYWVYVQIIQYLCQCHNTATALTHMYRVVLDG